MGRPVLEADPWVAVNLLRAPRAPKDLAFRRPEDPRGVSLAGVGERVEKQRAILGPGAWCYEFGPNRTASATTIRWAHEQGLLGRRPPPEELFVLATLDALAAHV